MVVLLGLRADALASFDFERRPDGEIADRCRTRGERRRTDRRSEVPLTRSRKPRSPRGANVPPTAASV
jgi:hypothetical protein